MRPAAPTLRNGPNTWPDRKYAHQHTQLPALGVRREMNRNWSWIGRALRSTVTTLLQTALLLIAAAVGMLLTSRALEYYGWMDGITF